ncbi:MAG: serine/threonine-protein kinase [Planctomycetota bacterium]
MELAVKNHLISEAEGQECLAASTGDVGAVLLAKQYIKERHLGALKKKLEKLLAERGPEAQTAAQHTPPPPPPPPTPGLAATDATFVTGPGHQSDSGAVSATDETFATGPQGGVGSTTGLVLFGQIALRKAFITQGDLDWALHWQPILAQRGQVMKIGEILVKGNRMQAPQVQEVLEFQQSWNSQLSASGPSVAQPSAVSLSGRGPATPDDPGGLLGRTWKGYEVQGVLGKGGMGAVYRALQTSLKRPVALKVMLRAAQSPNAQEERERFIREARLVGNLQHPNIVKVIEADWNEDFSWFTMEMVAGKDFKAHLRGGQLTVRHGAAIVAKIARAMHYAHERGIIHRDLKPQNVMIDEESGEPKILDFGLAKNVDKAQMQQLTQMGAFLGTPAYMAPEQAGGDPNMIDRRADVYALGAILYEVLTNRPPFSGKQPIQVIRKVLKEDPAPPQSINPNAEPRLCAAALKALKKDPDERFQSASDLADAIEEVIGRVSRSFQSLAHEGSDAAPPPDDEEPKKKGFFGRLFGG